MEFDDVIIVKTMKTYNCLYLSDKMKRKDEICYQEVIYYADFDNSIKSFNQLANLVELDDVIILKTMKT